MRAGGIVAGERSKRPAQASLVLSKPSRFGGKRLSYIPPLTLTCGRMLGEVKKIPTLEHEPMSTTDKRKQSLYFPEEMLQEIQHEANRQDRSLSWIVQQAWRIARSEIARFPSVNDVLGEPALPDSREEQNL